MIDIIPPEQLICSICLNPYDNAGHILKICPCGHSLCSACLDIIMRNVNAKCPICRKSMDFGNRDHLPISFDLNKILSNTCEEHPEVKNVLCLTCMKKICSACYLCKNIGKHYNHSVVHLLDIPRFAKELKNELFLEARERENFLKSVGLFWKEVQKMFHITNYFFEFNLFSAVIKCNTIKKEKDSLEELMIQIASLDDQSMGSSFARALGKPRQNFEFAKEYKKVCNEVSIFKKCLSNLPQITYNKEDLCQSMFLQIRRFINYDTKSKILSILDKNVSTEGLWAIKNPCQPKKIHIQLGNKTTVSAILNAVECLSGILKKQNLIAFEFVDKQITNEYMNLLQFVNFEIETNKLEINMNNCSQVDDYGVIRMLYSIDSTVSSFQKLICDFRGTKISNQTLITIKKLILKNWTYLVSFELTLLETNITDQDIVSLLVEVNESHKVRYIKYNNQKMGLEDVQEVLKNKNNDRKEKNEFVGFFKVVLEDRPKENDEEQKEDDLSSNNYNLLDSEDE